jgi:SAM-dependent methyltransferase
MTTDPYGDHDLVALYDVDNPGGADHEFYRALADTLDARRIVDLGCGTGLLTRRLAEADRSVTGIDPSPTMLDWARRQPGADAVTWLEGDATSIPPTGDIDLVVCTGNAIMHVSPEELPAVLRSIAGALRLGGTVSFESRNPAVREWERWTPETTYGERATPVGQLREWIEVTEAGGGRVVFDAHNVFPGGEDRVYTSVLYFRTAEEFTQELGAAGFTDITFHGDWHDGPVEDSSRILVFRARRSSPTFHSPTP